MTTVVVLKDNSGIYKGFYCMGHAEYAKRGKPDILCAAISALTIGAVNAWEELAKEKLHITQNEETGFLKCDFESVLKKESVFLMEAMIFSLQNLSREYGDRYLQVKFEEV